MLQAGAKIFFAAWLAVSASAASEVKTPAASRIVTTHLGLDELVFDLLAAAGQLDRLQGVSTAAHNPQYSLRPQDFSKVPQQIGSQSESLVAARPDLALMSRFNRPELFAQMRVLGVPTRELGVPQTVSALGAQMQELGEILGLKETAGTLWRASSQRITDVKQCLALSRPRVLALSAGRTALGPGTLVGDLLVQVGVRPPKHLSLALTSLPLSRESLTGLDVDLLLCDTTAPPELPRGTRIRTVSPALLGSTSLRLWGLLDVLAAAFGCVTDAKR